MRISICIHTSDAGRSPKKRTCVCNKLGVGGSMPIIGYKRRPGLMKDRERRGEWQRLL